MARLIDADELEKVMTEDWFLEILAAQDSKSSIKKDIENMIDSVPLAYDVDAVVEKLEADVIHPQCSVPFRILYEDFKKRAIQIVKDGGSDEP